MMRNVFLVLVFVLGCVALNGCSPSNPPSDAPPPPQDSGADKHKKVLFPIPEDPDSKESKPKEQEPKEEPKK
jgi:hypothetical protein